jgi:hypothetical protein
MVSSFRADSMLLGEDGYYVVSFLVAFEFLQSREIGSKLVGMTETEFERFAYLSVSLYFIEKVMKIVGFTDKWRQSLRMKKTIIRPAIGGVARQPQPMSMIVTTTMMMVNTNGRSLSSKRISMISSNYDSWLCACACM